MKKHLLISMQLVFRIIGAGAVYEYLLKVSSRGTGDQASDIDLHCMPQSALFYFIC